MHQWDRRGTRKNATALTPTRGQLSCPIIPRAPQGPSRKVLLPKRLWTAWTVSRLLPKWDRPRRQQLNHTQQDATAYFGKAACSLRASTAHRPAQDPQPWAPHCNCQRAPEGARGPQTVGARDEGDRGRARERNSLLGVGGPGRGQAWWPRAGHPSRAKDPCSVPSMASTPLVPRQQSSDRATCAALAARGPPGCPPTPNADMGARPGPGGRGAGGREVGVRTCPALPCPAVSSAHCTARYGYGYLVSFCFASGPTTKIQYGAHRPKPSARQTRKTPRRLYQPRGPPTHLIPADSPFALMFPRPSCDIHGLAALHLHGFILANTRSTTAAQHRLPLRSPTACLGTSGQTHSRLRLLPTSPAYLEVYDNPARVKGTRGSHKRV